MRPILMKLWLVAALMILLGVVPLPQTVFGGNSIVIAEQQSERGQQKQQFIRGRFEKILQQAHVQHDLIMAWQRKARLQQAKQRSQTASKRGKQPVTMAASR
jgi:hypothetical protein